MSLIPNLDANPRFQALSDSERADYHAALLNASPVEKLIVKELVWQGTQIGRLAGKCEGVCEKRFARMERFRSWILGIGVGLGVIGLIVAIVELAK